MLGRVKEAAKIGRRQRALMALAQFVCRRALWIVLAAVVTAGLSIPLTMAKLEFVTDRNALVNPQAPFNKRFLAFNKAFGDQELMLLMIAAAPGPENNPGFQPGIPGARQRNQMKLAAAEIAAQLRKRPELFPLVIDRVPPDSFGGTRLLYLPLRDLQSIQVQVQAGAPLLQQISQDPGYPGMLEGLRANIDQTAPGGEVTPDQLAQGGRSLATMLRALREALARPPGAPGMEQLFAFESSDPTLDEDGYLFIWDGRVLYVPVLPRKDPGALNQVQEPLQYAREVLAAARPKYPELAIGLSGRPVIYSDEMASSSRDMTLATILAIAGVGLLFVLAFRSFLRPLLAVISLVIALCWTLGATTLVIGHLNIFAMVFGVVLVGLGIDFGIHLLSHYRAGLNHGYCVRDALIQVYGEIGMGTVLGALTTAVALSTAALTDFLGLAELGLICGMGIMLCLVAMLVVFPAMLVLVDARRVAASDPPPPAPAPHNDAATAAVATRGVSRLGAAVMAVIMLASIIASGLEFAGGWIPFDYNLLELNDPSSHGVDWERMLIQHDQRASYAVSVRPSLAEVADLRRQYQPLVDQGLIRGFDSLAPQQEDEKRLLLHDLRRALPEDFATRPVQPSTAVSLRAAGRRLQAAIKQLGTRGPDFETAFAPALEELARLQDLIRQQPVQVEQRMAETEPAFFGALRHDLAALRQDSAPPPVTANALPEVLRPRYLGHDPNGRELHALFIYPAKDVWDHKVATEFNQAILKIDPQATGVTVQIQESADAIVSAFGVSVLYAALAILILLFVDLRRPLAVLVAILPLVGALGILLGVMSISDLHFNFANFFAVPILIGTSVDAGVYLVHSQRHGDPRRTVAATRKACVLCGLTTLLGFGTLIIASHRGIVSLGWVLSVGCVAGMLVSYFVVPAVLGWFNDRGKRL